MHFNPHPFVMTTIAKQRQEAIQAETDHHRRARSALGTGRGNHGQPWPDLLAATVIALALLTAGAVAAQGPTVQPLSALVPMDSISTNLLVAENSESSAVQKVREAKPATDADLARATPKLMLGRLTLTDILVS